MKDRRVLKTERAIRETFLSLLKDTNLNQITVTELSRRTDLGRGTFYLHYRDIYDLYDHIENELYRELEQIFDSAYPSIDPQNLMNLTEGITKYIFENRDVFLTFIRLEGSEKTISKLKGFFSKIILQENVKLSGAVQSNAEYDAVEAIFTVSGVVGVLEEWLNNGIALPQEQVASMLHRILVKLNT